MATDVSERYEILTELGRGGMGKVLKARDRNLNRIVALKVLDLRAEQPPGMDAVGLFRREARALAACEHPHVAQVYDIFLDGETWKLTMEFVEGRSLEKVLSEGPEMSLAEKLRFMADVCIAVDHVHTRGVLHRDIKPPNIMRAQDGSPKLLDFGIAKDLSERKKQSTTLLGTIDYASPEHFCGRPITAQTDIFALGQVLFEVLAGRPPFKGKNDAETIHNTLNLPVPKLPPSLGACRECLQSIVQRALAKDPRERYARAGAMADEVEACLAEFLAEQHAQAQTAFDVDAVADTAHEVAQRSVAGNCAARLPNAVAKLDDTGIRQAESQSKWREPNRAKELKPAATQCGVSESAEKCVAFSSQSESQEFFGADFLQGLPKTRLGGVSELFRGLWMFLTGDNPLDISSPWPYLILIAVLSCVYAGGRYIQRVQQHIPAVTSTVEKAPASTSAPALISMDEKPVESSSLQEKAPAAAGKIEKKEPPRQLSIHKRGMSSDYDLLRPANRKPRRRLLTLILPKE